MSKILSWLGEEFRKILPVWIFFFFWFGLLAITRASILGEFHLVTSQTPEYFLGSLIMAKVVVLVDAFLKKTWLLDRPLIDATVWNTFLYTVAALVVHYVEQVATLMRHEHIAFALASGKAVEAMKHPSFAVIMIWVIALTFVFCMMRELIRSVGPARVMQIFFGRPPTRTRRDDLPRAS